MIGLLINAAVWQLVDRIDRAALRWLVVRIDLPRPLVTQVIEQLAARVGAKLEFTELP
jgi:hypothetical protein